MKYTGSCLCNAVQYEVQNLGKKMGHCHCSMCRKFHGAAFATFGEVAVSDFKWVKGENEIKSYQADNGTIRKFCNQCGSSLVFQSASDVGVVEFALGSLDTPISERPDAHIYLDSQVDWYQVEDSLPQYKAGRE